MSPATMAPGLLALRVRPDGAALMLLSDSLPCATCRVAAMLGVLRLTSALDNEWLCVSCAEADA